MGDISKGVANTLWPAQKIYNKRRIKKYDYLCTGGAYYVPYSCLLISSKFCIGGGGGGPSRANKFLYAPAPPPPSVWALKPPSWALVHKTTNAPMIYTALCMFWMRAYPLLGQVGGGWALEFESFLGPVKWHRADTKHYARGCINHRCINSYYGSSTPGAQI
jgi:hypothetical protein